MGSSYHPAAPCGGTAVTGADRKRKDQGKKRKNRIIKYEQEVVANEIAAASFFVHFCRKIKENQQKTLEKSKITIAFHTHKMYDNVQAGGEKWCLVVPKG